MVIWIEPVGRKLFNITLGQPSQFSLPETLGEVQEGLGTQHPQESLLIQTMARAEASSKGQTS